ncbi:hypothetical protein [Lysobacter sp. HA35]
MAEKTPRANDDPKYLDMSKLLFDLLKHVATLSSGSILIVLTVAEKVLRPGKYPFQLKVAIWCFIVCIISSLGGMIIMAFGVGPKRLDTRDKKWFVWIFVLTAFAFTAAFVLLAALATSR